MIYLASPYSHPDPAVMQRRFEDVRAAAAALLARGEIVYSPIVHGHAIATAHELPTDFDFWLRHCFAMLERADNLHILKLDGWDTSRGVRAEVDWWKKHRRGIRVVYLNPVSPSVRDAIEGAKPMLSRADLDRMGNDQWFVPAENILPDGDPR